MTSQCSFGLICLRGEGWGGEMDPREVFLKLTTSKCKAHNKYKTVYLPDFVNRLLHKSSIPLVDLIFEHILRVIYT